MANIVDVRGIKLYVEEAGSPSGRPTLLLHGGLGLDHTYLRVFDRLPDSRPVYFDQRANGRSIGGAEEGVTMGTLAADAVELCAALGLGPVDVIGHSYGGFVGLEMALRHPEAVRQLVLVGTIPGYTDDYAAEVQAEVARRDPTPEIREAMGLSPETPEEMERMLTTILPLYMYSAGAEVLAPHMEQIRYSVEALRMGLAASAGWDVTAELGRVQAPTLVMCGRYDFICPVGQSELMAERIPGAQLAVFEQSGHFPWLEEPEEFWAVLDAFVSEKKPAPV